MSEKSRLENIWRSHEKSCRPHNLNTVFSHQQQQQTNQSNIKVIKREDLNEMMKQSQGEKKQASAQMLTQPQPPSIVRLTSHGNLSIQTNPQNCLDNEKNLNFFLQAAAAANSALLTPNSAFSNNPIETLLSQLEQQNSTGNSTGSRLQSPTQSQSIENSINSVNNVLQRPNNLNLRGGGGTLISNNQSGLSCSTPTPASLVVTSALMQVCG